MPLWAFVIFPCTFIFRCFFMSFVRFEPAHANNTQTNWNTHGRSYLISQQSMRKILFLGPQTVAILFAAIFFLLLALVRVMDSMKYTLPVCFFLITFAPVCRLENQF